ncbi:serine hydrolase [Lactobacillus delbrueckii subsp. bulgaricus]
MVHVLEDKIVEGEMLCHLAQRDWMMRDILDLMLSDSDNTATNFLIDFIGFAKMAAWFEAEFAHLHLGRYLMEVTDREIRYILFGRLAIFITIVIKLKQIYQK